MRIILLGPPGAGKGTQSKALAEKLKLVHISTGDLLRQNGAQGSSLGKEAKGYMDKGTLVPDELVTRMLNDRINQADTQNGFILDGYPRNIKQASSLDSLLNSRHSAIDMVFYLDTSVPVIVQRLTGRLVCKDCGFNFHIKNMPPKKEMTCDKCGGRLYQRQDDKEETIKKRLAVYQEESFPLIQYYKEKNKLYQVSSDQEAGIVLNKMFELVAKYDDSLKV